MLYVSILRVLILFETNKSPSSAASQPGGFGQIFETLRRPVSSTLKVRGEHFGSLSFHWYMTQHRLFKKVINHKKKFLQCPSWI